MSASLDRGATAEKPLAKIAFRAGRVVGHVERIAERVPPWAVLGVIMLISWGIAAEAGHIAQHNGWLYYNGGDGTWYYTTSWVLGHGHIPRGYIGYGYSLLLVPITRFSGSSMLDGLRAIVIFNQLVLAPIALVCVYGITRMFASRWYAYLVSLAWVLAPVAVIHYFLADYHTRYVDVTLPSVVGLSSVGDYPSLVVLLVATYFLLRAVATRADLDAVAAGLAIGFALVVKPANALFLPAVVVALALARRPRALAIVAASMVPSLIGLAIWKYRGLGYLPAFEHASAGAPAMIVPLLTGSINLHRYVNLDWGHLHHNLDSIREFTWSQRMAYWVGLAGILGLARRSLPAAGLAATWLASYLIVKGSASQVDFVAGSFLTHMIAAFPAYFMLAISLPFLVPIYGGRRPPPAVGPSSSGRLPRIAVWVLGAVTAVGLLAVAALPTLDSSAAVTVPRSNLYLPADRFPVAVHRSVGAVILTWHRQQPAGTRAMYAVFRDPTDQLLCTAYAHAATECAFTGSQVAAVSGLNRIWTDHPPPGTWTYRVALSATPFGPQQGSDYTMLSKPVTVTVRR